ncbi:MAG: phage holin family protein [Microgenomates group bacterium]
MKSILRSFIILSFLSWAIPPINVSSFFTLIVSAILLAVLLHVVKPVLKILFIPITIVTLGLFSLILNAGLLWLLTYIVPGFSIFAMTVFGLDLSYFWTLVVLSAVITFLDSFLKKFI